MFLKARQLHLEHFCSKYFGVAKNTKKDRVFLAIFLRRCIVDNEPSLWKTMITMPPRPSKRPIGRPRKPGPPPKSVKARVSDEDWGKFLAVADRLRLSKLEAMSRLLRWFITEREQVVRDVLIPEDGKGTE